MTSSLTGLVDTARRWLTGPRALRNGSLLLFGALSAASTFMGFHDLATSQFGDLPPGTVAFMAAFVLAATAMMMYFLGEAVAPTYARSGLPRWLCWLVWAAFAFFSIGFAVGFYWKFFAARIETNDRVEAALEQAEQDLVRASADLEVVARAFARARDAAREQAERERIAGNTCSDASGPGIGPRRQFRDQTADRARAIHQTIIDHIGAAPDVMPAAGAAATPPAGTPAHGSIQALLSGSRRLLEEYRLRADAASTAERAALIDRINSNSAEVESRYVSISSALKASERSVRQEAHNALDPARSIPLAPGTVCLDAAYADQMTHAADAVARLQPKLTLPRIAFHEGERGTLEAFARLGGQVGVDRVLRHLSGGAVPVLDERRAGASDQEGHRGLRSGDWMPLGLAVMVDLIILALSLDRRRTRYDTLTEILSRVRSTISDCERRELVKLLLRRRILTPLGGEYLVVPAEYDDADGFSLANAAPLWERAGLVRRGVLLPAWPGSRAEAEKVQKLLDRAGSGLRVKQGRFRLYRLSAPGLIETGALVSAASP